MKAFAALLLVVGATTFTTGCMSPGYSTTENVQRVGTDWAYDYEQAVDDVNHVLMLEPASRMTIWNVRDPVGD